jgi:Bacterial extracellular solute-binding proteins, family 5 Middle
VVAADVSPPGLDPHKSAAAHSWMITEHVYSNLLRRDRDMQIVEDLAESWQAVNDTTFVFKLRRGVQWHHGRALSADDVKYSFERLLDEKTASPWRSIWQIVDRIEVPLPPGIGQAPAAPEPAESPAITMTSRPRRVRATRTVGANGLGQLMVSAVTRWTPPPRASRSDIRPASSGRDPGCRDRTT